VRTLTAIVLTASLAAAATSQAPDRTARDARFTCQLLEDIIAPARDLGQGPIWVSRFFATNPADGPLRVESLPGFIDMLAGEHWFGMASEHKAPFRQLPLSMVTQAWTDWNSGGPVSCPDLTGVEWTTREAYSVLTRDRYNARIEAQMRGPVRPGVAVPAEAALPYFHEISRPTFDEFGYKALVIGGNGAVVTIYELHDGHWQVAALDLRTSHPSP
tara:strand:+ start:136 stop:783 length:648 start_codon:yes stop_codon:yes gene_type:complete